MMIFKKAIPRRTFLRGAGASLALPFLDAMVPAFAAPNASQPPLRLGYIYLPVGRVMENWTPTSVGQNYELTPSLVPFAPYREQMLVLSGLGLKAADVKPGERDNSRHERSAASYLTGVHAYHDAVGVSVDQEVANVVGQHTPLASLQLGLDPAEWANGNTGSFRGFFRATVSWRGPTSPLTTQNNPRKVFERLFGDTSSLDPETLRRYRQRQGSILDGVSSEVDRLMGSVSAGDRYKLDEYLDGVRDIERGIQVAESRAPLDSEVLEGIKRPAGIPASTVEHARLMFDLMHLAYQTDMTQVVLFMMGHEGTQRNYPELGGPEGHHSLSHHRGDKPSIEMLKKIDLYQSEWVAYFLEKMQSTKEIDGTSLLDNSMLVTGSALSDANIHYHHDLPIAVFGGAQGKLKSGRHIQYDQEPLSNLHLFVMDMFGAPSQEYLSNETSDGTGILKGLA